MQANGAAAGTWLVTVGVPIEDAHSTPAGDPAWLFEKKILQDAASADVLFSPWASGARPRRMQTALFDLAARALRVPRWPELSEGYMRLGYCKRQKPQTSPAPAPALGRRERERGRVLAVANPRPRARAPSLLTSTSKQPSLRPATAPSPLLQLARRRDTQS